MKLMHSVAFILVIVGGLNLGLYGLGMYMGNDLNILNMLLGAWPMVENLVYLLVGLSALVLIFSHKKDCRTCDTGASGMGM